MKRLSMFQVPLRLRSTTARHPLSVILEGRAGNCPPALLTKKSTRRTRCRPRRWSVDLVGLADVGRHGQAAAAERLDLGLDSKRRSSFRPATTTSAPRREKPTAASRRVRCRHRSPGPPGPRTTVGEDGRRRRSPLVPLAHTEPPVSDSDPAPPPAHARRQCHGPGHGRPIMASGRPSCRPARTAAAVVRRFGPPLLATHRTRGRTGRPG